MWFGTYSPPIGSDIGAVRLGRRRMTTATCRGIAIEYEEFGDRRTATARDGPRWPDGRLADGLGRPARRAGISGDPLRQPRRRLVVRDDGKAARVRPHGRRFRVTALRQGAVLGQRYRPTMLPLCWTAWRSAGPCAVGVSMDGMIARSMTIQRPDRVSSLTSIMSNTGNRRNGRVSPKLLSKARKLRSRTHATTTSTRRC